MACQYREVYSHTEEASAGRPAEDELLPFNAVFPLLTTPSEVEHK